MQIIDCNNNYIEIDDKTHIRNKRSVAGVCILGEDGFSRQGAEIDDVRAAQIIEHLKSVFDLKRV